jgi:hypothetical protein
LFIEHQLETMIKEDDTVTFEVSFVPTSQWGNVDSAGDLGEDAGRCELSIKTDDKQFWDVTLTDIYYKCTGTAADPTGSEPATTKCSDSGNDYNSNSVLSESSANN